MSKKITIIGIPMDFGQELRGVDMGPAAVRYTGLVSRLRALGHEVEDSGDIFVPIRDCEVGNDGAKGLKKNKKQYIDQIKQVCESVYTEGKKIINADNFPLFVGGDHSISIGTIASVTDDQPCGLIWVDAHADYNTPQTSESGNIHGMPLAVLLGDGNKSLVNVGRKGPKIQAGNVVMIGQRDLDPGEKKRLKQSGITIFTMRDIDEQGISAVADKALMKLAHLKRIHLTLDMDVIDPAVAPGVGTPVPGGLTYREAHLLMELVADSNKMTSMDLVEINPILDEGNKTAGLAVELTLSALGKSIL